MSTAYAKYSGFGGSGSPISGNLTDVGTDGIVITNGTGAVLGSGTQIAQHVADSTHNGYLTFTDWNTFNNKQSTLTLGNLTDAGTDGITITNGTGAVVGSGTSIAQRVADTTHNGYLSSADWNTFNGKGSVSSVALTVPSFLSVSGSPITSSGTLALTLSGTALPVVNGGTGVTSVTIAPVATAFAGWDANSNLSANNHLEGYATTATAAGTTTLVVGSANLQYFTGSTTQTVKLPVTSTLALGFSFWIVNLSSGVVTVQSSGANTIQAMAANTQMEVTCILTSGTTAASWSSSYGAITANTGTVTSVTMTVPSFLSISGSPITTSGTLALTLSGTALPLLNGGTGQTTKAAAFDALSPMTTGGDLIYGGASGTGTRLANGSSGQYLKSAGSTSAPAWQSFTAPTIQKFTTATSATYTTPTSPAPLYLIVTLVGGGGGGGGGGQDGTGNSGTAGNNSTFGSSTASGGAGGQRGNGAGGLGGGGVTLSGMTSIITVTGGAGGGGMQGGIANEYPSGGYGGVSPLGGAGTPNNNSTGSAAVANTGSGGAGGGGGSDITRFGGAGGQAGGYVRGLITSPSATYSYTVGASAGGGSAGTGTNAQAGSAGASGLVVVEEYYQ